MSQVNQQVFYRRHGVRQAQQLMSPLLNDLNMLQLPLLSIYHHVTYDGIALGPAADEFMFRGNTRPVLTQSVSSLVTLKGNPRRILSNDVSLWKDFRNANRRVRPLRDLEAAAKDPQSLVVYNYCFIGKTYRYVRSVFTEYFKWYNTFRTVIEHIVELCGQTQANQFLLLGVPRVIPSVTQLDAAGARPELTQVELKIFRDANSLVLLELWKWIGKARGTSMFSAIPADKLHLINLVFQETGKWSVINLGQLNAFRTPLEADGATKEELEGLFYKTDGAMDSESLQKRLLSFMMKLMEARTLTANIDDADLYAEPKIRAEGEDESLDFGEDEEGEVNKVRVTRPEVVNPQAPEVNLNVDEDGEEIPETPEQRTERIEQENIELNLELARLNDIATRQEDVIDAEIASVQEIIAAADGSLEQGVLDVCNRLADDGLLTAREYQRFEKHAGLYRTLKNPYNTGGTIAEMIRVKPEELKISADNHIADSPTILDKSMLKTSLAQFDSEYVDKILPRHAVAMVANSQKAGAALTDYQIEDMDDVLGQYEIHTVKLTPVIGAPSTLRFRIPKIDESGVFEANGVKYRVSKQRGD